MGIFDIIKVVFADYARKFELIISDKNHANLAEHGRNIAVCINLLKSSSGTVAIASGVTFAKRGITWFLE